jgi:prophage tail gpP-like protein
VAVSKSPFDKIELRSLDSGGVFDMFTSLSVTGSVVRSSEASFEMGDDGSYATMKELVDLGSEFEVAVNGRARMRGKVHYRSSPTDASRSSTLRCVVRTKTADMEIGSADPRIKVAKLSIKDVVLKAVATHGIAATDVVFHGDVSRNIMTGKSSSGAKAQKDLAPLKEEQAAVQPGETTKSFLDRHLRRHGLMMWDSPDGKIVVASPDDDQDPIYTFRVFRGAEGANNNVLALERVEDVSGVPSEMFVFGYGGGKDYQKTKISSSIRNESMIAAGFNRPVMILDEGVKTLELAIRTSRREYSERSRRQDAWVVSLDGFSFREGGTDIPYAFDVCCDIIAETLGGTAGKYYVEEVSMTMDPDGGQLCSLQVVKAGSWSL